MLGAIIGDIVGSIYEWNNHRSKDFELFSEECDFTDDTAMTLAIAEGLMAGGTVQDYAHAMQRLGRAYPGRGYGTRFCEWLQADSPVPYNSFGNGSAMRVAPVVWAFDTLEEVEAAYGIPEDIQKMALSFLPPKLKAIFEQFKQRLGTQRSS